MCNEASFKDNEYQMMDFAGVFGVLAVTFFFGRYAYSVSRQHDRPVMSLAGFLMAGVSVFALIVFIIVHMCP
ncbi:MAG: hypothetical protein ACI4CS_11025 [Candidatus Weimeria sp.]